MKTTKNKSRHFLRSKFFIIILCGLFINMSIANIGNVKAQYSYVGTPTPERPLNVYQNTEFGFSFLYPETVIPSKWEPVKDILSSVSLFPAENSSYLQTSRASSQEEYLKSDVLLASEDLESVVYITRGDQRTEVLRVPFNQMPFPMFNPYITLSPDGRYLTYVVIPGDISKFVSLEKATLWLIDLKTSERWVIQEFSDNLWTAPLIWSSDSLRFSFVQIASEPFIGNGGLELWWVDVQTRVSKLLISNPLFDADVFYQKFNAPIEWGPEDNAVTFTIYNAKIQQKTVYFFPIDGSAYQATTFSFSQTEREIYKAQPDATLSCDVPLYNQLDPQWKNDIMQTCALSIGGSGCALASTAMTFMYYGKQTTPKTLNQCLGGNACPINWSAAASSCSSGKVNWVGSVAFSWSRMEQELQQGYPPTLLLCKPDCNSLTHFVVVRSGNGSTAPNYSINDPNGGAIRNLTYYTSNGWILGALRIFHGTPACNQIPPITSSMLAGTLGENGWYRSSVQVTLSTTNIGGGSGVSQTQYKIDSGSWQVYNTTFPVSTDSLHTVYYKSQNSSGPWETEKSTSFKIDSTSPTGSFTIQNGSAQTYSTVVDLNTQASDSTSGVAAVHFRDAGQVTWSSWYIPGSTPWQLVGFNGQTVSVEAQFKDNAGNVSAVYSDNTKINLYPTRPSSSLYTLQRSTFGASGMNVNSSQYILNGTAGQTTIIGHMESSNYKMNSGYWSTNLAPPALIYPSVTSITRMSSDSTNATSVGFTVTFSKPATGVDVGDFSLMTSGVTSAAVNGVSGSGSVYTVNVTTGNGSGTIRLDVTDNNTIQDLAGNPLGGPGPGNGDFTTGEVYTIDKTAPAVGIFTVPSPSMSVDIPIATFTASDNIGVAGYLITNSATPPASGANGWTSVKPADYTVASDGSYTLYPWTKDAAGNVSLVFSSPSAVLVDTSKPTSAMTPLLSFVGSTMVPLSWFGSDALSGIAVYDLQARAEFDAQWTNMLSNTAQTNYTFNGIEGTTYYFRVRAKDIAGNVEEWREPYDTSTVGTDYGLTINNGALFTNNAEVVLTIAGKPETIQMQIDNDGGFSGVLWEPYTSHKTWQIIQYGNYVLPRIVYLRYKDIEGNVSATYQDDIILDVTPPTGTVSIASQPNGLQTMDSTVTLSLSATDDVSGVDQMLISNQADFTGATWENYAASRVWTIESNTAIYVKFRDNAGNVSSINSTNKPATFTDVPVAYWSWQYIERLYNAGITGGCTTVPLNYCPATPVTRAQMAIFLLRGMHGSTYTPAAATGTVFNDVPLGTFGAAWIEQLAAEGITSGCGSGNYCPTQTVSRAQMAVFLVRAGHGSAFVPPTATGIFPDVPVGSFGANYIEQLVADTITSGCGGGFYCPNTMVKRDSMAVFLVKTFNLP